MQDRLSAGHSEIIILKISLLSKNFKNSNAVNKILSSEKNFRGFIVQNAKIEYG